MADLLQSYVDENALTEKAILTYVDDYSIYSFYIGEELELRTKYSSPLRVDDVDPSFSLFYSSKYPGKIFFKDQATGKTGDVFRFLMELLQQPLSIVLLQINSDFGIGLSNKDVGEFKPQLIKKTPIKKLPTQIKITAHTTFTEEFINYWNGLDISKKTLALYYVQNPRVIHYQSDDYYSVTVPRTLTISYEILGKYKIYKPFEDKKNKFRNNYDDLFVEGALQLTFEQDFLIITKSTKECMFFREHFNWDAVAGKSENTPINPYFMENIALKRYKNIFIWLDNDEAGINAQNNYLEKYPNLIPIKFDDFIKDKDPTDLYKSKKKINKHKIALQYMKQLIIKKLTNGRT